jgi:hypothetical protein
MLKITNIMPVFTSIITTMNRYNEDEVINGVINTKNQKGALKEYQTVVAIGPNVTAVKVGDKVMINPKRFAVMQHNEGKFENNTIKDAPTVQYKFDIVTMNDVDYLLLQDRDILYVFEGEEIEEKPSNLILPKTDIIV